MASNYPVIFDVARPEKFDRPQVVLRALIFFVLSFLGFAFGWLIGLVYFAFPILAAIIISRKGGERFLEEDGPRITRLLHWIMAVYSYLGILTDRFPTEKPEEVVRFEVQTGGTPTVESALLRLILSIPSAIILGILGIVVTIIWLIAAVMILIQENYPDELYNFHRGVHRWGARLLAYHASLVDQYPPFTLDTGPEPSPAV